MLLLMKRTEPSAMPAFTPPACLLRAGTIPVQLSHAQPAPPTPAPPCGPTVRTQLGGAEVLNSELLLPYQAHSLPLLFRVFVAAAAETTASSAAVGKALLAMVIADTTLN